MYMLRSIRTRFMTKLFTWVHGGRAFEAEIKRGHQHGHLGNQSVSTYRYRATFWHKCDEFINSCALGPTNRRVPQPGAQGTNAEHPQAGSCQTAKDDGGKPGVRFLARSKRGTRFRTTSLLGGTRQRRRRFCSPWVGRDQGRRHCRWRSPDDRNWLSFHDRYQYTLSREAVRSSLRSSSKSAQRDSQSTLNEHNDNSKLTSHALKENRALTATAIQKVGPDRP